MDSQDDWDSLMKDHPIFSLPKSVSGAAGKREVSLELSLSSLPDFTDVDPLHDGLTPSGRRQNMVIKDADLIVAVGPEVRITALGDHSSARKSYKTLHTPNIEFEIHQIALNPNCKLLAVAGAFQVAVIVLPRTGFARIVPETIDCKSIQVGQYNHSAGTSVPIAKVDWHPWGEGGSTLMVMTVDGKLREYDISVNAEEPQQVLSFVPEKRKGSYFAEDSSEREVASFALGKGRADWGPLTVYVVMKSGDVYAICPYMPKNASIPSSYVHALECFVAAKQEYLLTSEEDSSSSSNHSIFYDYQHKYVTALLKQLPAGTVFPSASRSVSMHPPTTIKNHPSRQGPFLLQPSPRTLDGSEGGDATDIVYLTFGSDAEEEAEGETERLGVVLVAFQDGKVDVYLDVEKVEAKWENKQGPTEELPMLAVYETIDLGTVSALSKVTVPEYDPPLLDLLQGNHPVLLPDPIHDETVYVYHAFGVHALQLGSLLKSLAVALRDDTDNDGDSLDVALQSMGNTEVQSILTTFSIERKSSNPVVGVAVPNDVYLTYSIFILTSAMRITVFPLKLQPDSPLSGPSELPVERKSVSRSSNAAPESGPPAYVSLLSAEPFVVPPVLSRALGLPSNPRLSLPPTSKGEFMLTPDTLRYLGTTVERFTDQIHEVQLAHRAAESRADLQQQEFKRQRDKCWEMIDIIERLNGPRCLETKARLTSVQEGQKALMVRLDRILQALMAKASPELSEHETKWFDELRRIKEEVVGASRFDDRSLVLRTKLLRRDVDRLLPSLRDMNEKERIRQKRLSENNMVLGLSQAFELGKRSNREHARISSMEDEILRLANQLDITLARPPSSRKQELEKS
ncbi:Nucleoporin nup82 [Grifola frondosa]|uniref:Nucleoporin nup82 n=1 Tax=Grifola frondosa TaxID=5627 RepID=A0A1C7MH83_GRIFR|nr:Nucleoporin nup82 [Grifola frondosa]